MAQGIEEVEAALASGDFEQIKQAVEAAQFDARTTWDPETDGDYDAGSETFEQVVTPAVVQGKITREQWRELVQIWKSKPPATEEEEPGENVPAATESG